ncbi:MAG: alpha/beta hydrolase [Elusimicrobia bacterium]|nr:alpha/beta hydrolase [Elusimicrobiota bacterium]
MRFITIPLLLFSLAISAQSAEFVTFKADDDWQIHAKFSNPKNNKPFFLLLHAQKKNLSDFKNIFPHFHRNNYGYLALDLRGHGKSVYNIDETTETYKTFALAGADNQFNKMARDIEGAIKFLESEGISKDRLIAMGSLLGANLAIKTAAIHQEIKGVITLSAVLNVNDVLSVNPLKACGERPLLFITGTDNKRQYKEFQLLKDIAKMSSGEENITTIVVKTGLGSDLLTSNVIRKILAWIKNPKLPTIVDCSTSTVNVPLPENNELYFEEPPVEETENEIQEDEIIEEETLDEEDAIYETEN